MATRNPGLRLRKKRCGICREPGHNKSAHTQQEQQVFRLTGQIQRPIKVAPFTECKECHATGGQYHQPWCTWHE